MSKKHRGMEQGRRRGAAASQPSLTAWALSPMYRQRGERAVIFAAPCGGASLIWFFAGGPLFTLLGAGVSQLLDLVGVPYAGAYGFTFFATAMAMGVVSGTYALVGLGDEEFCWKQELAAFILALIVGAMFARETGP